MSTRYFHGSFALLQPGDVLVPGDQIGITVHRISAHVYAAVARDSLESLAGAIELAFEFGCYAADVHCTHPAHNNAPGSEEGDEWHEHYEEAGSSSFLPECVYLYEIEPIDSSSIEEDPSSDFKAEAVRMSSARVLVRVDALGKPWAQDHVEAM